jgi:hypothetical protein
MCRASAARPGARVRKRGTPNRATARCAGSYDLISENRRCETMAGKGGIRSTSFKPGQSGNPGGRPKGFAEVAELARSHAPAAITALVDIVSSAESPPAARVGAANALLDRGFGKPSSAVAIGGDPDGEPIKVQDLTPEDRAEAFTRAFRKLPDAAKPALLALLKDKGQG